MSAIANVTDQSIIQARDSVSRLGLRLFSKMLAVTVLFLIFMGANVTSNNAGLAVPDWPTSYGYNMFTFPTKFWTGGVFHEHVHRLVASVVGMLTVILAIWIWFEDGRKWVKNLALIGVAAVIVQGVLGGLTVRYLLPAWISSLHGVLAQTFFCLTIVLAYSLSAEFANREKSSCDATRKFLPWAIGLLGLLYIQLIIANFVRHTESGLAVVDFPTMAGSWIPSIGSAAVAKINETRQGLNLLPVESYQVLLHLLHRGMGVILLVAGTLMGIKAFRSDGAGRVLTVARFIACLLWIQFAFGAVIVLTQRAPFPTSIHVLTGALTLGLTVVLALRSWRLS